MGAKKGEKRALGNKGGGRKSAYQELVDAEYWFKMWFKEVDVKELQRKVKKGKVSPEQRFILAMVEGRETTLITMFRRLFPEKFVLDNSSGLKEVKFKFFDSDKDDNRD
jgi:hypothetical protein